MTLPTSTLEAIRSLQKHVGEGNRARGFREDEELLDSLTDLFEGIVSEAQASGRAVAPPINVGTLVDLLKVLKNAKIHGQANRLLLIVSEVVEAHDELRSGRAVNETYYIDEDGNKTSERFRPDGTPRKPEGVPSEIADTFIRDLDFADVADIDLAGIISEKDAYNATRPYKHGRSF